MTLVELDRALRKLRLSGIADVLETRLRHAQTERLPPLDLVATLVSEVHSPIARPASAAHTTRSRARLVVVSTAPPTPCKARPPISIPPVDATAHRSEAAANRTTPTTNVRRSPRRSPTAPLTR